jgi:pimeloyl-ACP methyl ester carboxylesterase
VAIVAAKMLQGLGLVLAAWLAAAGVAQAVGQSKAPRGQMVDIGEGRSLRLVCEGPKNAPTPTVWMEAGAFGGAADFGAIQQKLTAKGIRSCAYDRAGMGFSPTAPGPRDGDAISGDLARLMVASGESGPFILMAHSMGGLYVREFAVKHPDKIAGLVLIEAVTPELLEMPGADRFVNTFLAIARVNAVAGSLFLTKPAYFFLPDKIGLPPQIRDERRRATVSSRQARAALNEVEHWREAARQTIAAGDYDPTWPVAVITAADIPGAWEKGRRAPERRSHHGSYENAPAASHNSILGGGYNDIVVRGLDRVFAGLAAPTRATETARLEGP